MNNTGKDFNMGKDADDDGDILKIDSPRANVTGPYIVVFKNLQERWAILAFDYDKLPRLGIRCFWATGGNPTSHGIGTWLVVPPSLSKNILSGLPIEHALSRQLDDFLSEKITRVQIGEWLTKRRNA